MYVCQYTYRLCDINILSVSMMLMFLLYDVNIHCLYDVNILTVSCVYSVSMMLILSMVFIFSLYHFNVIPVQCC